MTDLLSRFTFQEGKLTSQIWTFALVLWLIVVACAVSSIAAQPFSRRKRVLWTVVVAAAPIIGLIAYLPFAIRRDELPTAFLLRGTAKDRKKRAIQAVAPDAR